MTRNNGSRLPGCQANPLHHAMQRHENPAESGQPTVHQPSPPARRCSPRRMESLCVSSCLSF
ncbi:hypothetical protein ATSB10_00500 [Dyella thiooxydans]|uniref:Uncharacterized protein n=1 Tax=Dyella thiooxydans TaxID=445710 RepID=A0A160MX29_9GAMM|nr:hypothetical protein ATSB10_00500 [Dyella thiooxydans]